MLQKQVGNYNLLIYRAFGIRGRNHGAPHKKPLDFAFRRPYNWVCAVQQTAARRHADRGGVNRRLVLTTIAPAIELHCDYFIPNLSLRGI